MILPVVTIGLALSRYQLCLVCQSWARIIGKAPGVVDKICFMVPFHTTQLHLLELKNRTRLDILILCNEQNIANPPGHCLHEETHAYTALGLARSLEIRQLGVHLCNQEWWKLLWMFPALQTLSCSITKQVPNVIPAASLRVLNNLQVMIQIILLKTLEEVVCHT